MKFTLDSSLEKEKMTSYETIQLQVENQIATIKIDRPKALNALNPTVLQELTDVFTDLKSDDSLRAVVITGEGKAFVAGADIAAMKDMTAMEATTFGELGHRCMSTIENFPRPVIAAVNGFALGGGLELALACDFIYASDKAKLGLPEVNLGIFPGFGGTQRLPRLIGANRAKELIFSARMISAEEAFTMGIVNKVCEADKLMEEVNGVIGEILQKGPVAISLAKRATNQGVDVDINTGLAIELATFPLTFSTEDKVEGLSAFLEKRKAEFKGK